MREKLREVTPCRDMIPQRSMWAAMASAVLCPSFVRKMGGKEEKSKLLTILKNMAGFEPVASAFGGKTIPPPSAAPR